ncbi:MAG: hypothetical protein Q8N78_08685 [Sulfurimonas sp.]|nr:hypothetical protein [Sulfurimonas sp.]
MLLSKLKIHLKTIVGTPSIDFVWSDEHNENFFSYLNNNLESMAAQDKEVQQTIKQALREHFESVGYILFKMSQTQLRMKIFAYKIEPKDSINVQAIIDIIDKNEDLIEYDYNGKDDLICLQKELTFKLTHFVNKITNEEINKKELLKYAVREAFELKSSDIVILKNNQIFIKLFENVATREVAESEKNTIADRYNGLDENVLKSFYKNFFLKDENKNFFFFIAEQFVDVYLLEKKIDNLTYEKYVFSLIQSIIIEHLESSFDGEKEFFKGFSGYIFRIHFKEVFGHIANLILTEVSASNKHIIEFLKYYSINVVVVDGRKYKVPEIEAENGLKWSVSSMMSIVKIYIKTEQSIGTLLGKKEALQDEIKDLYIYGLSPMEYNNNLNKEIEKISQELVNATQNANLYSDSLDLAKSSEEKESIKVELKNIKQEMQLKRDEKTQLTAKMIEKNELIRYNNTKKEIDVLTRQEKREEKILDQNKESFLSIKNSLVKALTSKKVLLEEFETQKQQ